jgi:phospholipid/cholesterol/gamma-HCH transport system substrate-binding protein
METRANHVLVGSFVLALVVAFIAFILWLGKAQIDHDYVDYKIFFKGTVTGLKDGNPVRYSGVPVGTVKSLRINPKNVEEIEVVIQVSKDTPVKSDTEASLEFQGITGVSYILLSGGTQDAPDLKPQPGEKLAIIASKPSQLERVIQSAPELLNRFIVLVDRANQLFSEQNQQAFTETLQNLRTVSGAAATHSGDIERILVDGAGMMNELRSAATSFDSLAKQMTSELTGVGGDIRRATHDLPPTLEAVRDAAASAAALSKELEGMVAENRRPIREFTASGLHDTTQLLQDLRTLISSLSRLTSRVEQDPARFFFGDQIETGIEAR